MKKKGCKQIDIEQAESEIKSLATKYGVSCDIRFGIVFLKTACEEFYFALNGTDIIKLMHRNACNKSCKTLKFSHEYHHQFTKHMTYEELMKYIVHHTKSRYKVITKMA